MRQGQETDNQVNCDLDSNTKGGHQERGKVPATGYTNKKKSNREPKKVRTNGATMSNLKGNNKEEKK